MLRSPPVSNPAAAMASTVRRFGSQPEANQDHGPAIRSWNRPITPSPRTCSRTTNLPPGASTRRISPRVAATSSTEHNTRPTCTESKLLSGNGIDSPIPSTMSTAMPLRRARARSHPPERRLRLHGGDRRHRRRNKHQVGSRAETNHEQPAGRIAHRRPTKTAIEQPVEERHAEPIHVREQRITAKLSAPQIQSERRIFVAHQGDIHGHPITPTNDPHEEVEHAPRDRPGEQQPPSRR